MGMDLYLKTKMITKYEYEKLNKGEYLLNKFNLEIIDSNDIKNEEKAFYLDIFDKIVQMGKIFKIEIEKELTSTQEETVYNYFKNNWEFLIDKYDIDILIPEWMENNEYITFDEWQKYDFFYDGYIENKIMKVNDDNYILIQSQFC